MDNTRSLWKAEAVEVQSALQCVMGAWQETRTSDHGGQPACRAGEGISGPRAGAI